jgi:hypothetical protein
MAPKTRFCRSMQMKQASTAKVQANRDSASSNPIDTGPSMRIIRTMASVWAKIEASTRAHAMGLKRALLALLSITHALAA